MRKKPCAKLWHINMIQLSPGNKYYYSDIFPESSFFAGFATALAGDSRNKETTRKLIQKSESDSISIVQPQQTHSSNVAMYEGAKSNIKDTDAVITDRPHVALTVITADCVPIIYADLKNKSVAISHQGWMGLYGELPVNVVEDMCMQGSRTEDIIAAIGPAIGDCCYDIPKVRADLFGAHEVTFRDEKYYLNLTQVAYNQLIAAGLEKHNIDYRIFCTNCDTRFFSYRRSTDKGNFPEQCSFIMIK